MKKRIWELDFFRGFAIIMMIFDHLMYDFMTMNSYFSNFTTVNNSIFNFLTESGVWYWNSELRFFGHIFFVSLFLLISGISYNFSKNNLSRGVKLLIIALLINLITYIIDIFIGGSFIVFGIIHLYAVSIILIYYIRKLIKNIFKSESKQETFLLVLSLVIIFIGIVFKFYDVEYLNKFSFSDLPGIILGVEGYGFGADYFSVFPYTGIILLGTVLGKQFYKNKVSLVPKIDFSDKNLFMIAGRKSLLIFILHQPILIGIIFIIGYIFGYRF
ncbi:MAG: heparan-alpha-glucosaminide N-acetyltransferase domain-containing protein [Candidatus Izemoplasmatales bacterium]|nr:heparan-alpha-glucosaminide N-acetyltransferase domain-containing protein [Candidatus Izemoplasmatales bacterium]MDD4069347.1 heparan-alpha-glucosaminide N-acetyltransferase domain-containing protein [Candidatus Izemoplasmatales bacterium]MDY0139359.1 heparan-alpha-glucosaminide N-acetyltransferase domain-containing protein [Candidatus Izemoplasmatales bacterium]